jgi:hypothetical protein
LQFCCLDKREKLVVSIDTTNTLIKNLWNSPYLFVTGITNNVGKFDVETKPDIYAQNFASAHNAGIALNIIMDNIATSKFERITK